jgi:hypothetical protein
MSDLTYGSFFRGAPPKSRIRISAARLKQAAIGLVAALGFAWAVGRSLPN